jgi:hypothetical protein
MDELGMSQSDVARAMWPDERRTGSSGYEEPARKYEISSWYNGKKLPNDVNAPLLAKVLGISVEELLPAVEPFPVESAVPLEAPPKDFQPDFTFKADGVGFAIIELKCRVPMSAAHEFMEVYGKHMKANRESPDPE